MATDAPRDLTAERAALLVHQRIVLAPTREAKEDNLKVIAAALKTARQEALREASRVADEYGAKEWDKGIQDAMARLSLRLDRLASEGGT